MMRNGGFVIMVLTASLLYYAVAPVLADPASVSATCKISCTVASIAEWSEANFSDIDMGPITTQKKQGIGKAELQLYTNGDIEITADNSNNAELLLGTSSLLTEYKLSYDGSGVNQTGGKTMPWTRYDEFLKKGSRITHISGDGNVEISLSVRASLKKSRSKRTGRYTATQTLTAYWKS